MKEKINIKKYETNNNIPENNTLKVPTLVVPPTFAVSTLKVPILVIFKAKTNYSKIQFWSNL